MPLHVQVDFQREVIFVRGEGVVTDEDLIGYVEEYLGAEGLRDYDELFDLSAADLLDVTYAGLARVAECAAATDPQVGPVKIALLVSEALGVGLSRMYQTLRESKGGRRHTRVFRNEAECRDWLGLPV